MKNLLLLLSAFFFISSCQSHQDIHRETDFNKNWKFSLEQEGDSFSAILDDSNWRTINLPHDWSVEFPFDSVNGEGCTAYLPGGIGWYRKHFTLDVATDEKVFIHFDGVYNNSEYWINGEKLGVHPYGYSPFFFDLTPHLDPKGNNVIAIKVDRSRYADSRWYSGSGIYRNVKLIQTKNIYIPVWGTFITTPSVSEAEAKINIEVTVNNESGSDQSFILKTIITNPDGKKVEEIVSDVDLSTGEGDVIPQNTLLSKPALWDTYQPNLYTATTQLIRENEIFDTYKTTFGIRSIRFDADNGFYLNGKNMKIKGVCLHHDGGLVGAAVPKSVWIRRLEILRDGGCNAIRISHNPAADEFLDLCDEMGFLVQDEFFDDWDYPKDKRLNQWERHDDYITRGYTEHFQERAETDLKNTMLSHRNHPSVIQWSIGNEIEWTYPRNRLATGFFDNMSWEGNYFWEQPPYSPEKIKKTYNKLPALEYEIGKTAQKLADWTREMDTIRPVIANCILPSASFETGYADALDIVGFSYRRVMYDYAKKHYPDKVVMGTENLGQWHEWKAIEERPFISGTFLWTGIDYMGESNGQWPKRNTSSGLLDQAGFPKPSWHMYKTLWTEEPHIYICSNSASESQYIVNEEGNVVERDPGAWEQALWEWHGVNEHWNYEPKQDVIVEVISNCPTVEIFLNEKSLGTKKLIDFPDRIYKWSVPFDEGTLIAKGTWNGSDTETSITTTGDPAAIALMVDKPSLMADGYEAAHVIVQLIDSKGNPVKNQERKLEFQIEGPVKSLGVDNGWARNTQSYQSSTIVTHRGRALSIIQSAAESGKAKIIVKGEGLEPSTAIIYLK